MQRVGRPRAGLEALMQASLLLAVLATSALAAPLSLREHLAFSQPFSPTVGHHSAATSRAHFARTLLAPRRSSARALRVPAQVGAGGVCMTAGAASEEPKSQENMVRELAEITDASARMAAAKEVYPKLDGVGLNFAMTQASAGEKKYEALVEDLQTLTQERLEAGRRYLATLLDSGEINVLDRNIVEGVKSGDIDPAFVQVLNMNIDAAEAQGEAAQSTLQVLAHVYTRVQEELEKKINPAAGLLHRLLRSDDASIRANIIDHFFKPKPEEEHEMVFVDGEMRTLRGALVEPLDFARQMTQFLETVRGGDFEMDAVSQTFEDCRVIAKETRGYVENSYDDETLQEFTELLTPVFQPIMTTLEKYRRT